MKRKQERNLMKKSNLNLERQTEINSKNMAWKIAEAADDRKAEDIVLLNVEEISFITDYFVIATGFSKA
jgi:ribosome-associated protein